MTEYDREQAQIGYPDDAAAAHQLQLEYEFWLAELARNEAARREFHRWLASTYEIDDERTDERK